LGYKLDHEALIRDIKRSKGFIPEVHVHGVLKRSIGIIGHLPLWMNNVVDYPRVMKTLKEAWFEGPYMFEITPSPRPREVIEECVKSKAELIKLMES